MTSAELSPFLPRVIPHTQSEQPACYHLSSPLMGEATRCQSSKAEDGQQAPGDRRQQMIFSVSSPMFLFFGEFKCRTTDMLWQISEPLNSSI